MSDLSAGLEESSVFDFSQAEEAGNSGREKESEARKNKAVKIIFAVLCGLFLAEILICKVVMPSLGSPKIQFSGLKNYAPRELADSLSAMRGASWFDFDVNKAASILASAPGIDSVSVRKRFPDKIYVSVTERDPVALTFVNENGHSVAVQIDKNGVLFPEKRPEETDHSSLPIISGLPVEHLTEGMRIPVKYRALIDQIAEIRKMPQKYFAAVSEICVVPKEYGNYELVIIPARSKIRVLTDRTLNEDALKYMMVVLDVVNSIEPNVSEIDLRYGSVSYRTR